jgi:AraC-like DNA-binding protein
MLTEGIDAAAAGHRVGYESPSQFSREYRRLFGATQSGDRADAKRSPGLSTESELRDRTTTTDFPFLRLKPLVSALST